MTAALLSNVIAVTHAFFFHKILSGQACDRQFAP
jgi:hypothetical protein